MVSVVPKLSLQGYTHTHTYIHMYMHTGKKRKSPASSVPWSQQGVEPVFGKKEEAREPRREFWSLSLMFLELLNSTHGNFASQKPRRDLNNIVL